MIPFDNWRCFFPPRPRTAIPFSDTSRYADGRWQAQLKINGTRNIIAVSPDGEVDFWSRHKSRHRAWVPPAWLKDEVRGRFACGKWTVLDSELLHSKHPSVKNMLYLFDALALDGQHLVGETYEARYSGLVAACGAVGPDVPGYGGHVAEVGRGLWLARMIPSDGWRGAWDVAAKNPIIEGLVLKRVKAKLEPGRAEENNGFWMIRVRKASKNYPF